MIGQQSPTKALIVCMYNHYTFMQENIEGKISEISDYYFGRKKLYYMIVTTLVIVLVHAY